MNQYSSFSKQIRFDNLCKSVQHCSICKRFINRNKVLSSLNGNINSKVLFVAEAPGRLGADRTGIPLHGDRTGGIYESLIAHIKWMREQLFITNSVLCNPRENNGNNDTPTKDEIFNCSLFLDMTIELIQPEVVVPLGNVALEALAIILPHFISLKNDVGKLVPWNSRYLFPLYHPGPRALVHRPYDKQLSDYIYLAKLVNPLEGIKDKQIIRQVPKLSISNGVANIFREVVLIIVNQLKELSLFKLTKLLYLIDLTALEQLGKTLTEEIYLRQKEGPWVPNLKKLLQSMNNIQTKTHFKGKNPFISIGPNYSLRISLKEEMLSIILEIVNKYGNMDERKIKSIVYLTEPMKYILRQEKAGRNMQRAPVIYKDKIIAELDKIKKTANRVRS